jgi:hypothetical protein
MEPNRIVGRSVQSINFVDSDSSAGLRHGHENWGCGCYSSGLHDGAFLLSLLKQGDGLFQRLEPVLSLFSRLFH